MEADGRRGSRTASRMRRPGSRLGVLRAAQHTGDGSEPGSRVNGRPLPAANDAGSRATRMRPVTGVR